MASAKIVYASMTGNDEEIADVLEEAFENLNVDIDVSEISQTDAAEFEDYDICIVVTYTYGDGELPDEAVDFFEDLQEEDLSGKIFGCAGSGDTFYDDFAKSVDDFAEAFKKTGAKEGAPVVKVDLAPEEDDIEALNDFANKLVAAYNAEN
ncbi:flavodoxin [Schleiferilactobacillus perolens]|jgi:flavodoxin short chain|uniref:flavodoxin n=1 Tax=Schleiferilactobacillus perolens TaxID=100468 RepID=UPI0023539AFB|nr:flavodoxin [Schleiferilactobacillus perolens]MCI2171500.1 flavodoxin [Schleiferilactobacillus perolens]